jgi:hypothetical protein
MCKRTNVALSLWSFSLLFFSGFPKRKALKQALSYDGKRKESKKVL